MTKYQVLLRDLEENNSFEFTFEITNLNADFIYTDESIEQLEKRLVSAQIDCINLPTLENAQNYINYFRTVEELKGNKVFLE